MITDMKMDLSNIKLDKSKKSIWCRVKGFILDLM
jgi:hypothetical protein